MSHEKMSEKPKLRLCIHVSVQVLKNKDQRPIPIKEDHS